MMAAASVKQCKQKPAKHDGNQVRGTTRAKYGTLSQPLGQRTEHTQPIAKFILVHHMEWQ